MPIFKQPFFSRGEVSPRLYGRVDTSAYQSALRTARNVIVGVGGGVFNRPGTLYVTACKYFDKYTRLIPFSFNATDTCLLEFGDFYMRVIREDFPQMDMDAKNITAIDKGVTTTVHVSGHGYSNDNEVILTVVGMDEVNKGQFIVASATTDTFVIKSKITGLDIDSTAFGTLTSGTVDRIYEIVTPYAAEDLALLKFAQSADVLTLVHTGYPIKELKRFALNDWQLVDPEFVSHVTSPTELVCTAEVSGAVTTTYTVTAIDSDTGAESLPGLSSVKYNVIAATNANPVKVTTDSAHNLQVDDLIYLTGFSGMTEVNDRRFRARSLTTDTLTLFEEDGTNYGIFTSATTNSLIPCFIRIDDGATTPKNLISWDDVPNASAYDVYKSKNGIYGFIGETSKPLFEDDNIDPDLTQIPPTERNPFRVEGDYPGAVGFYQQRRVFGGSDNSPDTWYASQPGDFSNFATSSPAQDDDAITATLVSGQVNQIKHIVTNKAMLQFTAGSEWVVSSGGEVAFSPFTVNQEPQTNWGVSEHRPLLSGEGPVLFVQEDNRTVRSFGFDFQVDGYKTSELSLLSDHIFHDYGVKDWALARTPYSAAVFTRTDGDAAMLVFNEEQNVIGWTRWDTKGDFETVGVIRVCLEHETPEPDDGIYFVVKRNVGGRNVKYIERLHKRRFLDVRDAFFVDSGASYDPAKHIDNVYLSSPGPLTTGTLVFNCPNHGYTVNQVVAISNIEWESVVDNVGNETQPDQFNDDMWMIVNVNDTEFTVRPIGIDTTEVNISDFTDGYKSYIKGGVVRRCAYQVTGLWHLEGETVSVLADGFPIRGVTVTNGAISIPGLAGRIHVGLPYTSDVELLDIEPSGIGNSTAQGKFRKVNLVTCRFDKSRELLVGPNSTDLIPMKRPPYVDQSAQLFTGDRDVTPINAWNQNGRVFFRMIDPMPFNLLAVFLDMAIA